MYNCPTASRQHEGVKGRWGIKFWDLLQSTLNRNERSASRFSHFYPEKRKLWAGTYKVVRPCRFSVKVPHKAFCEEKMKAHKYWMKIGNHQWFQSASGGTHLANRRCVITAEFWNDYYCFRKNWNEPSRLATWHSDFRNIKWNAEHTTRRFCFDCSLQPGSSTRSNLETLHAQI